MGKTGICGVRENHNGELMLLVENKPVTVNIDPVEKKPLYHFLPGTPIFSLGTLGCNFHCGFCQNWDISQILKMQDRKWKIARKQDGDDSRIDYWKPGRIIDYCLMNNIPSIAFTYNEPTVFIEYALAIIKAAKRAKIKTVFVSNGYQSKISAQILVKAGLDAINIDLKSFTNEFYLNNCGAKLQPVLDNIKGFWDEGIWVEVTTLIIPAENDSEAELKHIAEYMYSVSPDIPWHISRFHPEYLMQDKPVTEERKIRQTYTIGRKVGLKYIYAGNIETNFGQDTVCPKCQTQLITRTGYQVTLTDTFNHGQCQKCKTKVQGVWQ